MVYVGGQNAIDAAGEIVGATLSTQTEQALKNVIAALEAAHATPADVIKLQIYIVQNQDIREALAASQKIWGTRPTAITTVIVAGLSDPRYLIEIDAIAAIKR